MGNEKLTILCAGLQARGLGVGGGGSIGDRRWAVWRTLRIGLSLGHPPNHVVMRNFGVMSRGYPLSISRILAEW